MRNKFWPFLILTILIAQCFYFALSNGQTVDETFYNGSGYPMVRYNDYRILGEHPPLVMQLGSLPLLLIQPKYPINDPIYIGNSDGIDISKMGSRFLYEMGNNAELILLLERIVVILLTLFLGCILYLWSKSLFGEMPALFGLILFSFCPNIIAHGSLFTTDMGVTVFIFTTFYFLNRFFENHSIGNILLVGLFAALSMLSKMSALILVPAMLCLVLLFYLFGKKNEHPIFRGRHFNYWLIGLSIVMFLNCIGQKIYMAGLGPLCLLVVKLCIDEEKLKMNKLIYFILNFLILISWTIFPVFLLQIAAKRSVVVAAGASLWVLSLFILMLSLMNSKYHLQLKFLIKVFSLIWIIASFVIILGYTDFPRTFLQGRPFHHFIRAFNIASDHALADHKVCVGDYVTCDWRYFLAVMSIKTPLYTLIVFAIGFFWLLTTKTVSLIKKSMMLVPFLIFLIIASFLNRINIGLRHVLPIYPFIFLICSGTYSFIQNLKLTWIKRPFSFLLVGGLIYFVGRQVLANPNQLSYFNEFVGSAEKGVLLVGDSNLNWGQDNKRLSKLVKKMGNPLVKLGSSTRNPAEYQYYGLNWAPISETDLIKPEPGLYALDINLYTGLQKKPESWFKSRKPDYKAGETIYIFKV